MVFASIRSLSTSSVAKSQLQPHQNQSKGPRTLTYDEIVELQNTPRPPPKLRDPAKNPPIISILLLSLIGLPPMVYYYWQYRDEHMKAKKYAMLKDIQARAGRSG
ncbi:Hypothetical protein D9617_6g095080 [Elsinoe fawcettii]|nr:Hypothetical protein D9617_6g095080 [Elsinoe fawcettii]